MTSTRYVGSFCSLARRESGSLVDVYLVRFLAELSPFEGMSSITNITKVSKSVCVMLLHKYLVRRISKFEIFACDDDDDDGKLKGRLGLCVLF